MTFFSRKKIISQKSGSGGGGGATITVVANYAALPSAATVSGQFRWVSASTGVHLTGLYYSNGATWEFNPADDITVVANYSALPAANTVSGQFYWCSASQGTAWLPGSLGGTYYNSGLYYSNGTSWEFLNVPYNATQAEVDTGTNNDKFVTPSTLTNAVVITNKAPLASPTFTGTPAAPTASVGTNTTQLSTTAFALANGTQSQTGGFTAVSNPGDATTVFFGYSWHIGPTTTGGLRRMYTGFACTITKCTVNAYIASGVASSETFSIYIRVNNTTDYLITSSMVLTAANSYVTNQSLSISLGATDYYEYKIIYPTFATNPLGVYYFANALLQPA